MKDMEKQIAEKELREQIDNIFESIRKNVWCNGYNANLVPARDDILALIPKPTVRVKCDKCGGKGEILSDKFACGCTISSNNYQSACGIHTLCYERERVPCPSCTDGWNEHEIERVVENGVVEPEIFTLTLADLIDPDVAWAYGVLSEDAKLHGDRQRDIRNNKGVLRIGGKA